jgi:LysM repeat protein
MRYFLILTVLLITGRSSFGVSFPDSIAAQVINGRKLIIHKIEPRETWFSLSRKYGVSVKAIQEENPGISVLEIGETVKIPASRRLVKGSTVISPQPPAIREQVRTEPERKPEPPRKKPYIHTVSPGETMFSIARKYEISVANLRQWNNLTDEGLKVGQELIVDVAAVPAGRPSERPSRESEPPAVLSKHSLKQPKKNTKNPYSMDPWERMESLADSVIPGKPRVTPGRDTAVKKMLSGKPGDKPAATSASPGTKADPRSVPGKADSLAQKTSPRKVFETPNLEPAPVPPSQMLKVKKDTAQKALKEITEQGAASWINDELVNPNKFYALHRTAPIGTIIKVTNIANQQSVFVKVVGILPDTGDNTNLLIKISRAAAKKLGVSESKFQAELNYGMP